MTRLPFTASIVALICLPLFSEPAQAQRNRNSDGAAIAGGILSGIGNLLDSAGRANQGNHGGGGWQRYQQRGPNTSGFQNQNGFADGNDFFGNNNNNNWSDNNWSSGYQRPSTTYYRPSPTYTTPSYTTPSTVYSSGQVSYRAGVAYTSPKVLHDPPVARLPIELLVPKGELGICSYQLLTPAGRAYDYVITPGQKQKFSNTTQWKIRYDQGQAQGVKTYDLRGGKSYELRKNDAGLWQLYMKILIAQTTKPARSRFAVCMAQLFLAPLRDVSRRGGGF